MTDRSVRETGRWAGVDAVAWAAAAVGLFAREPAVVLLAAVGVVFSAHARLGTPPDPALRITRDVDDAAPRPGQTVTVRLTVENAGERLLPDVRVVDGVPAALAVAEGSPHLGTALRAGESLTHTYTLRAERGTHAFDPVAVACRNASASHEVTRRHEVPTTLTCRPAMRGAVDLTLRDLFARRGGQTPIDSGGSGVEFHGVREYRPGDRAGHIDWTRRARTGELATLEFRAQRRASVVLCLDARTPAYVRAGTDPAAPHALEHAVRAAADVFGALQASAHRAGIAAVGREFVWLGPGDGESHRRRARELLSTHPTLSPSPARDRLGSGDRSPFSGAVTPDVASQIRRLETRLTAGTQVVFLSPLADAAAVTVARRLEAAGHAVSVLSPDVTGRGTEGETLAGVARRNRIRELSRAGIPVVDWRPPEPLGAATERAREAWR